MELWPFPQQCWPLARRGLSKDSGCGCSSSGDFGSGMGYGAGSGWFGRFGHSRCFLVWFLGDSGGCGVVRFRDVPKWSCSWRFRVVFGCFLDSGGKVVCSSQLVQAVHCWRFWFGFQCRFWVVPGCSGGPCWCAGMVPEPLELGGSGWFRCWLRSWFQGGSASARWACISYHLSCWDTTWPYLAIARLAF